MPKLSSFPSQIAYYCSNPIPQIFLGNIGSNEARFTRYYCNKREKEYTGCPIITYENPNGKLGENVTLIEKGEYRCRSCNNLIALYHKFNNK
jgi:hypothetical protein